MKPANLAPIYVGLYPALAELCRDHGYALAVHGSMARDFDLIAVPWISSPSSPEELLRAITASYALQVVGTMNQPMGNGRLCTTLVVSHGECFLDFSVMTPGTLDASHARRLNRIHVALLEGIFMAQRLLRQGATGSAGSIGAAEDAMAVLNEALNLHAKILGETSKENE